MEIKFHFAGQNSPWQAAGAEPAGFWSGLWHGAILPIAFVVSLFKPEVGIYERNNDGRWYNFGFVLGASGSLGGKKVINTGRSDS